MEISVIYFSYKSLIHVFSTVARLERDTGASHNFNVNHITPFPRNVSLGRLWNMQMHYANLPHCVTNLHSYLLLGVSIFQILYLILALFKGANSSFETTKRSQAASFLYKFDFSKFVTFCHWWSRNFLFCKGESEEPRFFYFITEVQPKAGTGLKMQTVFVVFSTLHC